MPLLDRDKRLVGILALGDVAAKADSDQAGVALSDISEPAEPNLAGDNAEDAGDAAQIS